MVRCASNILWPAVLALLYSPHHLYSVIPYIRHNVQGSCIVHAIAPSTVHRPSSELALANIPTTHYATAPPRTRASQQLYRSRLLRKWALADRCSPPLCSASVGCPTCG